MHEFSIASAVVDAAVRHAGGRPVTAVSLRIGGLRQVVPETLELAFGHAARGTACEGARLQWELVVPRVRCGRCGRERDLDAPVLRCPDCPSAPVEILCGEELEVESIEVEAGACTG